MTKNKNMKLIIFLTLIFALSHQQTSPMKRTTTDICSQEKSELCNMPPNVLSHITSFLTEQRDINHFSQTCKLMRYEHKVQNQGYQLKIEDFMLTEEKFPYLLKFIANQRFLKYISACSTKITSSQLQDILNVNCGKLKKTLTFLRLTFCSRLNDFSFLGEMQNLQHLDVFGTKITSEQLQHILNTNDGRLKATLTYLNLCYCKLNDFSFLSEIQNLRHLGLSDTCIRDYQLQHILNANDGRLKATLTILNLSHCHYLNDFSFLCEMQNLRSLYLCHTGITNGQLRNILNANDGRLKTTLRSLSCGPMYKIDISWLENMKLENLFLERTYLTDDQLEYILRFGTTLKYLSLFGCENITNFSCLKELKNLKYLNLSYTKITDNELEDILLHNSKLEVYVKKCNNLNKFKFLS